MMIEPSIDVLVKRTNGNRYILCNLIAKRAKNIENEHHSELADKEIKSISIACQEVAEGKVVPSANEDKIKLDDFDK